MVEIKAVGLKEAEDLGIVAWDTFRHLGEAFKHHGQARNPTGIILDPEARSAKGTKHPTPEPNRKFKPAKARCRRSRLAQFLAKRSTRNQ